MRGAAPTSSNSQGAAFLLCDWCTGIPAHSSLPLLPDRFGPIVSIAPTWSSFWCSAPRISVTSGNGSGAVRGRSERWGTWNLSQGQRRDNEGLARGCAQRKKKQQEAMKRGRGDVGGKPCKRAAASGRPWVRLREGVRRGTGAALLRCAALQLSWPRPGRARSP